MKDLIDLARAKPGQLNYASAGNGTSPHLAMELFKSMAKVNITGVPYIGGPPTLVATLSGEVQMTFGLVAITLPHLKSGNSHRGCRFSVLSASRRGWGQA